MKTMKTMLGIVLSLVMLFSMTTIAMAADITIDGGADGAIYTAYKLLNAADGGEGKFAYTLSDKYTALLQEETGKTTQADVVDYIEALDASGLRDFADNMYLAIANAGLAADYTSADNTFTAVDQGYYLIAESQDGTDASDTFSLVMLDTAGQENITVTTKEDVPSVEKQVEEINDTTGDSSWGSTADYDIGDSINFTLTGTVSGKYADYSSYYYSFIDTMDDGLTYNNDAKVYVVNGDSKTDVTAQFTIAETADNGFTVTANLKELTDVTVAADSVILVEYSATLNENAISGNTGNLNTVYLEYENNPYHVGDGDPTTPDKPDEPDEPGKTPEDTTIVFTFDVIVNKVDKDGNALEGAGFTLYKNMAGTWTAVGEEITGVTTFTFEGVDVGEYKLVETTVPVGYNKCDDVVFEVVATYDTTADPYELTGLSVKNEAGEVISEGNGATFTATVASGEVSTDVVNLTGAELPETGGIGTTILYVVGGVLVIGAVVLLVTKKRMKSEN